MRSSSSKVAVGLAAAALGLAFVVPAAQATPARGPRTFQLRGSSPSWAAGAKPVSKTPGSQQLSLTVMLQGRDQAGAAALAAAVSTPGSSQYGQYLSTAQYNQRFAPTDAQLSAVRSWLSGAGLKVTEVASNNRLVSVTGTAAQAEAAFGTSLANYKRDGSTVRAAQSDISIPADLAGVVGGVNGLSTPTRINKPDKLGVAPPPDAFVNATPCSTYWAQKIATTAPKVNGKYQPYSPCGYTPSQLQGAYGLSQGYSIGLNGQGTTVAIVDAYAAPTIVSDANTYAVNHGGAAFKRGQFKQITPQHYTYGYEDTVNGDLCGENGWYGEETLDVEAVHAIAPGANILYVAGSNCLDDGLLGALNKIVANHRADIITNSWGDAGDIDPYADAATLSAYTETFVQAALEGIGVFFSSGDSGDEVADIGSRQTDFPASDPWVTAVGGTSLAVGASNNYLFETGWGTSKSTLTNGKWAPKPPGNWVYGAGGGTSQVFVQPAYQKGVVPRSIANYFGKPAGRAVPDVAAVADPNTGFLVGETQTFPAANGKPSYTKYSEYRIGGTSLASPVMAGIEALADQAWGRPHGFANYQIYRLAGTPSFHDIVSPNQTKYVVRQDFVNSVDASDGLVTSLRALNQTESLVVQRGYDDVTGVGTPNGMNYILRLGR
jgi:subtilase family serine protease